MNKKNKVPLERALSKRGLASRKEASLLIEAGKISIGGKVITDPFFLVVPETMKVKIEGMDKKKDEAFHPLFIVFNKPKSCITTTKDEKNRKTVYDYLTNLEARVVSVGRLDFATCGLLFFTNINRLMDFLTEPKNSIPRTYHVSVRGEVSLKTLEQLHQGVVDKEEKLKAEKVVILKASQRETHLLVTLTEGKNREIRRLFKYFRHEVTSLKRISFGNFELDVEVGKYRKVEFDELAKKIPQTKALLERLHLL